MYSLLAKCVRHLTIPDCMGKDTCKLVIQQRNLTYLLKYCSSSFLHLDNKIPNRTLFCNEQKASVDFFMFPRRYKFKKPPKTWAKEKDVESDTDSDSEDTQMEDGIAKIITGRMQSLRADAVLKTGLGLPRNKVESLFYENKIHVNGEKISKKSSKDSCIFSGIDYSWKKEMKWM
ncbi:uncharacterized protein isoform X2 [Rhodnius prolixus]|uniref:uncharacterized protein isoform X2 n=1 Tax=Rhodnius prolixus TaxID=13249 RepID=UPI003D18CC6E